MFYSPPPQKNKVKILLDELIKDEKKINRVLYSAGPYWYYNNKRAIREIKKKGLKNFRGTASEVGKSFTDYLTLDFRNNLNIKGSIVGKIFSLPYISMIFDGQLNITKKYLNLFIKNQSIIYESSKNVKILMKKYKFENTVDFGAIQLFKYSNKNYSCHYLQMADRIDKLSKSFDYKKIKSFFEIGGGFGANIHFLIQNFPNIKKILYLDVVPNIYIGTSYLKKYFGKKVKDYTNLKNLNKISFTKNDDLEILCITPWLIEKVEVEIDHFHNACSFVEMPKEVIKNYIKFIKKFKTKEISLISYDNFDTKTTFNPKELNEFFDNKMKISWKNGLIKECDTKLIYLTSK